MIKIDNFYFIVEDRKNIDFYTKLLEEEPTKSSNKAYFAIISIKFNF